MFNISTKELLCPNIGYMTYINDLKSQFPWVLLAFIIVIIYGHNPKAYIIRFILDAGDFEKPLNILGFVGLLLAYIRVIFSDLDNHFIAFSIIASKISILAKNVLVYTYKLALPAISVASGTILGSFLIEPKTLNHIYLFIVYWP